MTQIKEEKTPIDTPKKNEFKDLGVNDELLQVLDNLGFNSPTPIQEKSIPLLLAKKDVIAQAKTGSGKTLAFALPTLQNIEKRRVVNTLVLSPTRELAQQIADVFKNLCRNNGIDTTCVVGKESYRRQIEGINRGSEVVIATPGRILDLIQSERIVNFNPQTIIFDEADEMLNMGFIEDIKAILAMLPKERQTVFFSATFPPAIINIAKAEQKEPNYIKIADDKKQENDLIEQIFCVIKDPERKDALVRLLNFEAPHKALIFCRTKDDTEFLQGYLSRNSFKAKMLHGDLTQAERTRTVRDFKLGLYNVLIATDVASRGLDVDDLSHVFNFNLPENFDRYTHRIGRTGRAGKKGKAFTLSTMNEWSNNFFLRKVNIKNISFKEIPSRTKIEEITNKRIIDESQEVKIDDNTKKFLEELSSKHDPLDLAQRLFLMLRNSNETLGPQFIGLSNSSLQSFSSKIDSNRQQYRRTSLRSNRRPFSRNRTFSDANRSFQRGTRRRGRNFS